MDVNGTKFHLIHGQDDWAACLSAVRNLSLGQMSGAESSVDFSDGFLQLYPSPPIFRKSGQKRAATGRVPLIGQGVVADFANNIYHISADGSAILVQRAGNRVTKTFWTPGGRESAESSGDFVPYSTETPTSSERLRGLAIASKDSLQYLVAGVLPQADSATGGLYLIPISGGPLSRVSWKVVFEPSFICATEDGKAWILDNKDPENPKLWWVDVQTQLVLSTEPDETSDFVPGGATRPATITRPNPEDDVRWYSLTDSEFDFDPKQGDLIGITTAPDGGVLALMHDKDGHAVVFWYGFDPNNDFRLRAKRSFDKLLPDPDSQARNPLDAVALVYVRYDADCSSAWLGGQTGPLDVLVLMEAQGDQAIALEMTFASKDKAARNPDTWKDVTFALLPDYLPVRDWSQGGLLRLGCRVWFDSGGVWSPLQRFEDRVYEPRAVIITSPEFPADYAVQPFDGEVSGCVWHRLLLDAVIPPGCQVQIRARAADDPGVLIRMPWLDQPALYRRGVSSELPWYTPPPFRGPDPADEALRQELDPACFDPVLHEKRLDDSGAGAWELLFQEVYGRYLQLELTLQGTGRTSPEIYALRAWYPRFSWLERYLPALYREDRDVASFLERWLANFEGFFTELEGLIENFPMALDPRITPAEALEWLAGWMGLLLDPQWSERQRRFFIRHAMSFYRLRGTPRGLEAALRLYLNDFDETIFRLQQSTWNIRLREHFRVGLIFSDPPVDVTNINAVNLAHCEAAHTFSVLVPPGLTQERRAMIERIVELEKPAHTRLDNISYSAGQLVLNEVILGEDTLLRKASDYTLIEEALPKTLRGPSVRHPALECNEPSFSPKR